MKDQGSSFSIPSGSFYCPLLAEPSKAPTGKAKQKGVGSSSNQCEAETLPKKQASGVVAEGTHPSAAQMKQQQRTEDGQPGPPLSLDIASPVFTQVLPDLRSSGPECRSTLCTKNRVNLNKFVCMLWSGWRHRKAWKHARRVDLQRGFPDR